MRVSYLFDFSINAQYIFQYSRESFYLDNEWEHISTLSVIAIKFWAAITYFAVYLQATEMYPTCLRQTGLSIGIIGSNIVGIVGPYIAYLVSKHQFNLNNLLPLIVFLFSSSNFMVFFSFLFSTSVYRQFSSFTDINFELLLLILYLYAEHFY